MLPVGFEPTISVGERSQTYVLDGAATGTGVSVVSLRSSRQLMCENLGNGRIVTDCDAVYKPI